MTNLDQYNFDWDTALLVACKYGMHTVAIQIIKSGSTNLNQRDKNGNTALMVACCYGLDSVAQAILGTKIRINVNAKNDSSITALTCACRNNLSVTLQIMKEVVKQDKPYNPCKAIIDMIIVPI